ncbi:MAG: flavin reductase family protein [Bryobacteraceae bacterium]
MSRTPSHGVGGAEFRRLCSRFATGVAIATTLDERGQPHGMTVNSFASVSLDPPMVLICVDLQSNLMPMFLHCRYYGVNVLNEDQQELSHRFAQSGHDRFGGIEWQAGKSGVPLLPGALAHFECRLDRSLDAGDHAVLIGEVVGGRAFSGSPLLYFESKYRRLK